MSGIYTITGHWLSVTFAFFNDRINRNKDKKVELQEDLKET